MGKPSGCWPIGISKVEAPSWIGQSVAALKEVNNPDILLSLITSTGFFFFFFLLLMQAFDILHPPGQSVLEGKHNQELALSLSMHLHLVFHRNVTRKFGNTLNSCQCSLRVACFYL